LSASHGAASFARVGNSTIVDQGSALAALREHLAELQLPQIAHRRRGIVLLEGPEGSGKKYALKQLAAAFDPCQCAVHSIGFDRREASEGHWLARFWRCLPGASRTAIFYRSWYLRVLDDRISGRIDENMVARAFDEINEFEAQQRDYGTLIVKLYFEVSPEIQEQRLARRAANPWSHGMRRDEPIATDDPGYRRAFEALKANSDTRWSPWLMIDGNDEEQAAVAALGAIADAWAQAMPAEPPHLVAAPVRA
jgi:AMP-polyphosphate phosphotransferase